MTITGFALPILFTGGVDGTSSAASFADTVLAVTPVAGRTERMVSICTLSLGEAPTVDIAVLLLAAIGVFGAFRSALGAVDVNVAFGCISSAVGIENVAHLGVRRAVADIPMQCPIPRAIPIVHAPGDDHKEAAEGQRSNTEELCRHISLPHFESSAPECMRRENGLQTEDCV